MDEWGLEMKRSKVSEAMMKKWESSKEDKDKDKSEAKKRGITVKKWESSALDERMDKMAIRKKMNRK